MVETKTCGECHFWCGRCMKNRAHYDGTIRLILAGDKACEQFEPRVFEVKS